LKDQSEQIAIISSLHFFRGVIKYRCSKFKVLQNSVISARNKQLVQGLTHSFIDQLPQEGSKITSEAGQCSTKNHPSSFKKKRFSINAGLATVMPFLVISSFALFTLSSLLTVFGVEVDYQHGKVSSSDGTSNIIVVSEFFFFNQCDDFAAFFLSFLISGGAFSKHNPVEASIGK